MKDELIGEIIEEVSGLRARMYSLKSKKAKMKKRVKISRLSQNYVKFLFEGRKAMHTMQTIQSFKHQLYNIKQNKFSLNAYDETQYLIDDGVSSLAYGHFSLF